MYIPGSSLHNCIYADQIKKKLIMFLRNVYDMQKVNITTKKILISLHILFFSTSPLWDKLIKFAIF